MWFYASEKEGEICIQKWVICRHVCILFTISGVLYFTFNSSYFSRGMSSPFPWIHWADNNTANTTCLIAMVIWKYLLISIVTTRIGDIVRMYINTYTWCLYLGSMITSDYRGIPIYYSDVIKVGSGIYKSRLPNDITIIEWFYCEYICVESGRDFGYINVTLLCGFKIVLDNLKLNKTIFKHGISNLAHIITSYLIMLHY